MDSSQSRTSRGRRYTLAGPSRFRQQSGAFWRSMSADTAITFAPKVLPQPHETRSSQMASLTPRWPPRRSAQVLSLPSIWAISLPTLVFLRIFANTTGSMPTKIQAGT